MIQPIDGPVLYASLNISTVAELKVGASALEERKLILIQPKGNSIFIGSDNSVTTANGIELFKNQIIPIEVGPKVTVYAIASSGTIEVRIWEMA